VRYLLFIIGLLIFFPLIAEVPEGVKAGAVEKPLIKKEEKLKKKEVPTLELKLPEKELKVPDKRKFLVKGFKFEGNTIFTSGHLLRLIKDYQGKKLSLRDLKKAAERITRYYRSKGYFLARAYIPAQEIKDGKVKIAILEGRLGKVKVEGARYYRPRFIRANFHPTKKGALHYPTLLKSLLILNEFPHLKVKATLLKGKKPGTTDILLKVSEENMFAATFDYNNFGSKYVSRDRYGLNISYTNLALGGDTLGAREVSGSTPERLRFSQLYYTFPVNTYGTKASLYWLYSEFEVKGEFEPLEIEGKTEMAGIKVTHPLIRTRAKSLDIYGGFDYKNPRNYLLSELSSEDLLRILKLGVTYDCLDRFRGRNYLNAQLSGGLRPGENKTLGIKESDPSYASRVGAEGEFTKLNLDYIRLQKLPISTTYAVFKFAGQLADDDLPVCEQLGAGGGESVRGYTQSEYMGDYGYITSFEIRFPPPEWKKLQFLAFFDYGNVYKKNPLPGEEKNEELAGAGVGLRVSLPWDLDISMDWGFPLHPEKNREDKDSLFYVKILKRIF